MTAGRTAAPLLSAAAPPLISYCLVPRLLTFCHINNSLKSRSFICFQKMSVDSIHFLFAIPSCRIRQVVYYQMSKYVFVHIFWPMCYFYLDASINNVISTDDVTINCTFYIIIIITVRVSASVCLTVTNLHNGYFTNRNNYTFICFLYSLKIYP